MIRDLRNSNRTVASLGRLSVGLCALVGVILGGAAPARGEECGYWTASEMAGQAYHAMAFDSWRGVMVLNGAPNGRNTWELHGDEWRVVAEGPAISGDSTAMAFDSRRGVTVLAAPNGEIWEWDGAAWAMRGTNQLAGQQPTTAVFNELAGISLIFTTSGASARRVFAWNGTTMTEGSVAGVPNTAVRAACYVPERGGVQVFIQPGISGELWESAGGGWTLAAGNGPNLSTVPRMVHDPNGQKTLVVAPGSPTQPAVWQWDGSAWAAASSISMFLGSQPAMAFDSARNRVVLQGGDINSDWRDSRTWQWSEGRWRRLATARPFAGLNAAMVHDSHRGVHVLFTGATAPAAPGSVMAASSGEVWEWNGAQWVHIDCNGLFVAGLNAPQAAYDAARRNIVVLGASPNSTSSTDTWTYSDGNWTNVGRSELRASSVGPMTFDPLRNVVVMIAVDASVWEWNGASWTVVESSPRPASTTDRVAEFEASLGLTVVQQTIGATNETWGWNGATWQPLSVGGPAVAARMPFVAAGDDGLLLLRKSDAENRTELWAWSGGSWSLRSTALPFARTHMTAAYDVARRELLTVGGAVRWAGSSLANIADLGDWLWKDGGWTALHDGCPIGRVGLAAAFDSVRGETVVFGGRNEQMGGAVGDTWTWNGGRWRLKSVDGPSPRSSPAMAFDAARGRAVLFGGRSSTSSNATLYSDTWTWDGTAWTRSSAEGPSRRYDHVMAYHPLLERVILHGGRADSQGLNLSEWEFDGSSWNPRGNGALFTQGGICFDESFGTLAGTQGLGQSIARWLNGTWTSNWPLPPQDRNETYATLVFDHIAGVPLRSGGIGSAAAALSSGGGWVGKVISTAGPGSSSIAHAAVFDEVRGRMVRFGGGSNDPPFRPVVWEWTSTFARPSIELQAGWRYAREGQVVVFSGAVEYSPSLTARWYRGNLALGPAVPVPPSGEVRLELPVAQFLPSSTYYFQASTACCDAASEPAAQRTILPGDTNCDGFVTIADIGSFVTLLTTQQPAPGCFPDNGDCNDDGFVTVADIGPFVSLLTGG